jgi:hypothetical protein
MPNLEVMFALGSVGGFGLAIQMTCPNQALEHNAIAPSFLFCHADHGVAHL